MTADKGDSRFRDKLQKSQPIYRNRIVSGLGGLVCACRTNSRMRLKRRKKEKTPWLKHSQMALKIGRQQEGKRCQASYKPPRNLKYQG